MGAEVTLRVVDGPRKGREFKFDVHDTFVFGRSAECHHSLPEDPYISGRHFLIEVNPPECVLRDLGSKNGTKVNGARLAKDVVPLRDGDVVKAGLTEFKVAVRTPEEPPELPELAKPAAPEPAKPGFMTGFLEGMAKQFSPETPEFPGFEVLKKLKDGGMGEVYLAKRREDGRTTVVKVVKPQGPSAAEKMLKLFRREMEVSLERLRPGHRNIVEFLESGQSGRVCYFAMEYCAGGSVLELMCRRGGTLPPAEAVAVMAQALEGLAYAHSKDIVHRDLKPDNILLAEEGGNLVAKVADFGLAKNFAMAGLSGFTSTGDAAGTWQFMPKEQLLAYRDAKPVSDVFAMGAALYNMLTGFFPYDGPDYVFCVMEGKVVPIRRRGVALPPALMDVVDRATAPEAADRYQSAREFRAALLG